MTEEITQYPLTWPEGWTRTRSPEPSKFGEHSIAKAIQGVLHQLELMGFPDYCVIISSNLHLQMRLDGLPYSNQRQPKDKGVSVWWRKLSEDTHKVIALDKYNKVEHNLYAVAKTIEAMRGIRRWGGGEILERTFTGFQALPGPGVEERWQDVLQVGNSYTLEQCERNYRILRKDAHPDHGGSTEEFNRLQNAIEKAREELS